MVIFSMLLLSSRAISSVTTGNTVDISLPLLAKMTFKILPESGRGGGREGGREGGRGREEEGPQKGSKGKEERERKREWQTE